MNVLPKSRFAKVRFYALASIAAALVGYFAVAPVFSYVEYAPREGDILFQSLPVSELTRAVEGATGSPYSHTGLLIRKDDAWYVREAVGPVIDTRLYAWIMRGRGAKFAAYRLKRPYRDAIPSFIAESEKYLGLPYDIYFELDDEKIYCSELVYKAYRDATQTRLGVLKKLKALNWEPHRDFIESIEVNGIPLEREMITPVDLARAPELEKVYSNGL